MPEEYLPTTDPKLQIWFGTFAQKFAQYATQLGFLPADVTAVNNDYAMIQNIFLNDAAAKAEAKERTKYKKLIMTSPIGTPVTAPPANPNLPAPTVIVAPAIIPRVRLLVQRIKLAPNYNASIGSDMGIVGKPATPPDPATVRPTITATVLPGSVQIKFVKGTFAGVQIESRRGANGTWEPIGVSLKSPFADTRPPLVPRTAESRDYRAVYFVDNAAFGQYSTTVTVSTLA